MSSNGTQSVAQAQKVRKSFSDEDVGWLEPPPMHDALPLSERTYISGSQGAEIRDATRRLK